ncbi:hypothetical protein Lal_00034674 [Lupinus albus]|nr:hypothetical protein Lal_00034674 [Lupinus albus]
MVRDITSTKSTIKASKNVLTYVDHPGSFTDATTIPFSWPLNNKLTELLVLLKLREEGGFSELKPSKLSCLIATSSRVRTLKAIIFSTWGAWGMFIKSELLKKAILRLASRFIGMFCIESLEIFLGLVQQLNKLYQLVVKLRQCSCFECSSEFLNLDRVLNLYKQNCHNRMLFTIGFDDLKKQVLDTIICFHDSTTSLQGNSPPAYPLPVTTVYPDFSETISCHKAHQTPQSTLQQQQFSAPSSLQATWSPWIPTYTASRHQAKTARTSSHSKCTQEQSEDSQPPPKSEDTVRHRAAHGGDQRSHDYVTVVFKKLPSEAAENVSIEGVDVVRRRSEAHLSVSEVEDDMLALVANVVTLEPEEKSKPVKNIVVWLPLGKRRSPEVSDSTESCCGGTDFRETEGRMVSKEVMDGDDVVWFFLARRSSRCTRRSITAAITHSIENGNPQKK